MTIRGRHKNGKDYDREDWLPVRKLGISGIMENEQHTEAQAHARVRSRVLLELGLRTQQGETVFVEVSGETYTYNRDGEWQISSMATEAGRDGEAVADVAIRQPMAAFRRASARVRPSCLTQSKFCRRPLKTMTTSSACVASWPLCSRGPCKQL